MNIPQGSRPPGNVGFQRTSLCPGDGEGGSRAALCVAKGLCLLGFGISATAAVVCGRILRLQLVSIVSAEKKQPPITLNNMGDFTPDHALANQKYCYSASQGPAAEIWKFILNQPFKPCEVAIPNFPGLGGISVATTIEPSPNSGSMEEFTTQRCVVMKMGDLIAESMLAPQIGASIQGVTSSIGNVSVDCRFYSCESPNGGVFLNSLECESYPFLNISLSKIQGNMAPIFLSQEQCQTVLTTIMPILSGICNEKNYPASPSEGFKLWGAVEVGIILFVVGGCVLCVGALVKSGGSSSGGGGDIGGSSGGDIGGFSSHQPSHSSCVDSKNWAATSVWSTNSTSCYPSPYTSLPKNRLPHQATEEENQSDSEEEDTREQRNRCALL